MYAAGANLENTRRQDLGYQGEARERREPGRDGGATEVTVSVTMTSPNIGKWHIGDQDGHNHT